MGLFASRLEQFPWDALIPFQQIASSHPQGLVNLSVGTPVDPTPELVADALRAAANAPGYPATYGTPELREAVSQWFARRRGVTGVDPAGVLPTVGSKELVALLPAMLELGPGDVVVHPAIAYPTYDVGATLAGARALPATTVDDWRGRSDVKLVWLNSPSNPTGAVDSVEYMAGAVAAAREIGAVVASDECYAELAWSEPYASTGVPSILDPRVSGGDHSGLIAVYSLSKQSNLAGYRAAFAAGDPALISRLLELRKHAGFMVPAPIQAAVTVALGDDRHVAAQKQRYGARRAALLDAVKSAGFTVDYSDAGLYLWASRGEDAWTTVEWLAHQGILAAPGTFYGPGGQRHVRLALTASDEAIASACERLTNK